MLSLASLNDHYLQILELSFICFGERSLLQHLYWQEATSLCTPRQFRLLFGEAHGRCGRGWRTAEAHRQETDTGVLTVVPYRRLVIVAGWCLRVEWIDLANATLPNRGGTRSTTSKTLFSFCAASEGVHSFRDTFLERSSSPKQIKLNFRICK